MANLEERGRQNLCVNAEFSFFRAPITNVNPSYNMRLAELSVCISMSEPTEQRTNQYRALPEGAKKAKLKTSSFDYVTFSGTFSKRSNTLLDNYSGLMVLDIDDVGDVDKVKEIILNQSFFDIALMFISPSGKGIKVVVPSTTEDQHQQVFHMYKSFLEHELGIIVDGSGSDVSRPCFISYDPDVYLNLDYKFRMLEGYWDLPQPVSTSRNLSYKQDIQYSSNTNQCSIWDFDKRGDIHALLLENGWSVWRKQSDKIHYTRPGKNPYEGPSGNVLLSINYLYIFTTASSFEPNRGYTASEVFAIIKCGGDMHVASEQLKGMGYGYQGDEIVEDVEI